MAGNDDQERTYSGGVNDAIVYYRNLLQGTSYARHREYLEAHAAYVEALLAEDEEFLRAKAATTARTDETARRMARVKTKGEALKAEAKMIAARALMEGR